MSATPKTLQWVKRICVDDGRISGLYSEPHKGLTYEIVVHNGLFEVTVLQTWIDRDNGKLTTSDNKLCSSSSFSNAIDACQTHYDRYMSGPKPTSKPEPTRNLNDIDNEIYGTLSSLLKREMTFDAARQRLLKLCEELRG